MVLNELGARIGAALAQMSNAATIDEGVLDACLKEISNALVQADVNVRMVMNLRANVKKRVNITEVAAGLNARRIIEKAVYDELCAMLDGGAPKPKDKEKDKKGGSGSVNGLKKGKPNVVMFVGLQGSGKTTTCTKYAFLHKKQGFRPAMVCADTFRAGAFDQLKQNATKAQIPFYGSYQETDPAVIAKEGVDRFKQEGRDLIIVDTSGRHKQSGALFEEMRQVASAVEPDLVIFVMDSSIGQAAQEQAQAFRESVQVGQVIVTKMDGHAKGGGALSAVAATKSPISYIGTGEHMHEFEEFEASKFVSRLLGKGDWKGFIDKVQTVIPEEDQPEMIEKIAKGNFTMRIMYEQFQNLTKMGPMSQVMGMIPGFSNALMPPGHEKESSAKIKRFMTIMDSMTDKELDSVDPKLLVEPTRVVRIAKGSGHAVIEVQMLLEEHKRLAKMFKSAPNGPGSPGAMSGMKIPKNMKGGKMPNMHMDVNQMSRMIPPHMLQMMGGPAALQNLMKSMEGKM